MREQKIYCDRCHKEVDCDLVFHDEDEFYNKDFCSYECLYFALKKQLKEEHYSCEVENCEECEEQYD